MARNEIGANRLEADPDRLQALLWLLSHQRRGPGAEYTPPLTRRPHKERPRSFAVLELRGSRRRGNGGGALDRAQLVSDHTTWSGYVPPAMLPFWLVEHVFCKALRGHLIVVPGGAAGVFASIIEQCAADLIALGWTIEPISRNGRIQWLVLRRHRHKWTLADPTVMTGLSLKRLLSLAPGRARWAVAGSTFPYRLRAAVSRFGTFIHTNFGASLRPSVSMIAMSAARAHLPTWSALFRTPPLLEAFERVGGGYRGGWQWGDRFRGTSWRLDINRAFTFWLGAELPYRVRLVKWRPEYADRSGVFVCTVRGPGRWPYPLGVWSGSGRGFVVRQVHQGSCVAVVHAVEFESLRKMGYIVEPGVGFIWRETFSLGTYVDQLQELTDQVGRTSALGEVCKWLGNTVYGKFGGKPEVEQLRYRTERPDRQWRPFLTVDGRDLDGLWYCKRTRRTIYQHVEVAAEVAALARAHLADMAAGLADSGVRVVRIHTDSLTTTTDPLPFLTVSDHEFGMPRVEYAEAPALIYLQNGYSVLGSTHLSGAPKVPEAALSTLVDGGSVTLPVHVKSPPWGEWPRGGLIRKTFGSVAVAVPAGAVPPANEFDGEHRYHDRK